MRQVMRHELQSLAELSAEKPVGSATDLIQTLQKSDLHLTVRPPIGAIFCTAQPRIKRVPYPIDVRRFQSRMVQTKPDRLLGKLLRIVDPRRLGMLDAVEPLFLARRHHLSVDHQSGRRFMKDGIDSENVHLDCLPRT